MGQSKRMIAGTKSGEDYYLPYTNVIVGNGGVADSDMWKAQLKMSLGNGFRNATVTGLKLYMWRMGKFEMQEAGSGVPSEIAGYTGGFMSSRFRVLVDDDGTYTPNTAAAEARAAASVYVYEQQTGVVPMNVGAWVYFDLTSVKDEIVNHPNRYLYLRDCGMYGAAFYGAGSGEKAPYLLVEYAEENATDIEAAQITYVPKNRSAKIEVKLVPEGSVCANIGFEVRNAADREYVSVDGDGNVTMTKTNYTAQIEVSMENADEDEPSVAVWVDARCEPGLTVLYGTGGAYHECEAYWAVNGEWKRVEVFMGADGEWIGHDPENEVEILRSYP